MQPLIAIPLCDKKTLARIKTSVVSALNEGHTIQENDIEIRTDEKYHHLILINHGTFSYDIGMLNRALLLSTRHNLPAGTIISRTPPGYEPANNPVHENLFHLQDFYRDVFPVAVAEGGDFRAVMNRARSLATEEQRQALDDHRGVGSY